jgi:hypothetical protein
LYTTRASALMSTSAAATETRIKTVVLVPIIGPLDSTSLGGIQSFPVTSRQSPSDTAAPTVIPKRNNVPVDPVR